MPYFQQSPNHGEVCSLKILQSQATRSILMLKHEDVFVLSIHAVLLPCLQNRAKIIQFFSQRRGGEQRRWLMLVNEVEREDPAVAGNNLLDLVLHIRILARPRRLHV